MKLAKWLTASAALLVAFPAWADQVLPVTVGRSAVVTVGGNISKVSVADPQTADVVVLSKTEVLINAKKPGATTLIVWTPSGRRSYDISVKVDTETLKAALDKQIGPNQITVQLVNENVILTGRVEGPRQVEMAEKLASGFATKVINLLQTADVPQVKVDVQVVEINKNDSSQLGVKWGGLRLTPTGDAMFSANHMTFAEPSPGQLHGFMPFDRLAADIELLVKNGKAKILSNPSLVAASGGSASFLVGGEVPIPMAQSQGQVTVDWKEYGVKLDINPTVLESGKIALKLRPEVSTLDYSNGVRINNFSIPALSSRKTETQIMLQDGQSLFIGGLLQNQDVKSVEKLPLLGDIPVLGELFKSQGFQSNQTELTVMVTPHLVKPKEAANAKK